MDIEVRGHYPCMAYTSSPSQSVWRAICTVNHNQDVGVIATAGIPVWASGQATPAIEPEVRPPVRPWIRAICQGPPDLALSVATESIANPPIDLSAHPTLLTRKTATYSLLAQSIKKRWLLAGTGGDGRTSAQHWATSRTRPLESGLKIDARPIPSKFAWFDLC